MSNSRSPSYDDLVQRLKTVESDLKAQKSHLKRVLQDMQNTRSFLDALMDQSPFPLWVSNAEGTLIRTNQALRKTLNLTDAQLVGKYNVFQDKNLEREGLIESVHKVFQHFEPTQFVLLWKPTSVEDVDFCDGRELFVDVSMFPIVLEGKLRHVVCQWADITERVKFEEELRESEARYRDVVEEQTELIARFHIDGTLTWVNDFAAQYAGQDSQALIGCSFFDFLDPAERLKVKESLAEISVENPVMESTQQLVLPNGDKRWLQWRNRGLFNADGDIVELQGVGRDITQQRLVEDALRESDKRLHLAMESASEGVWEWDFTTDLVTFDKAGLEMLGYEPDYPPQPGTWWIDQIHDEDRFRVMQAFNAFLEGETSKYEVEFRLSSKTGTYIWIVSTARVFHADNRGNPLLIVGIHRDISLRKQAEEDMRRSDERFRLARDLADVGVWEWNIADNTVTWTEEIEAMYGYTPGEFDGSFDMVVSRMHPEDIPGWREAVRRCVEDGEEHKTEYRVILPDNSVHWLMGIGDAIRDENGVALRMVGISMNITERKRLDDERERLSLQLQQAQKMEAVGRLAGGVAHDFNNMVAIILGYSEMILEELDPQQPFYSDLQEIQNAGQRSADLTRQLLAFARKQTVTPRIIDLNKTVSGMLKMLERLIGEDIEVVWIPGDTVWPVKFDPGQVDQILANLCVNARDAIKDVGKVTIETGNTVFDENYCKKNAESVPGDYVMLAVSDNGSGMDTETLEHLFEPFFTTKDQGEGTGLGLAMVYGIVKQNNGFINVYSEKNLGTSIKIYLPRQETDGVSEVEPEKVAEPGHETILLVEDEPAILKMTTRILQRAGYVVVGADTPGHAIHLAEEHLGTIHLLITDVVMPEMNGRDLAKKILSLYPHLSCLFMSGYTANVIAQHGVLDEGVNFIQKPFSKKELTDKVREALDT